MEIADHGGERVRPGDRADDVERVGDIGDPVAQRLVHGVFERMGTGGDGNNFRPQHLHAEHVGLLPLDIDCAHVNNAFQPKARADRGCRNAMLARTGFRDDAGFAHAHSQQNLAHHIIDFMRAGMVELIPLQIDLGATQMLGEPLGKIKRAGATDIMGQIAAHLFLKRRIDLDLVIGLFQRQDERHQGFRHKAPAENTKVTGLVRTVAERIGRRCVHFKILLQSIYTCFKKKNCRRYTRRRC